MSKSRGSRTYHIDRRDEAGDWQPETGLFGYDRLHKARRAYRDLVACSRATVYRLRKRTANPSGEVVDEVLHQSAPWILGASS